MAFSPGAGSDSKTVTPTMNVTPLVDVVLVLLIIFMVITPLLTKKFWVHTPKQDKQEIEREQLQNDPNPPLVLRLNADETLSVNGVAMTIDELPARLQRMFAARDDHVLFFDADDSVSYGTAVQVLDHAREGGAVTIATLTKALAAAPGAPAPDAAPPVTAN